MKKLIKSLLMISAAAVLLCCPCGAVEQSVRINDTVTFSINGEEAPAILSDGSIYTWYLPQEGEVLTVTSEQEIGYLYIFFGETPESYSVSFGKVRRACGQNGFLHELIEIGANEVTVKLPGSKICSVEVYSSGTLPADVQDWDRPVRDCDMLAFPTHADDDTLYFGPAIVNAVSRGLSVQIAYMVNHWDTVDRPHELLNGIWEMGVRTYPIIGEFPDIYSNSLEHASRVYIPDTILQYQVEMIRRFRPKVVLGHDLNGEYGHGAHMLNAVLLTRAIELSGEASAFPGSAREWGAYQPMKLYLHLYGQNQITLDVHAPLEFFEGRSAFEKAEDAYAKHISQHKWTSLAVEDFGDGDCRLFGLYFSSVGQDAQNDIFENIPPDEPPRPVFEQPAGYGNTVYFSKN